MQTQNQLSVLIHKNSAIISQIPTTPIYFKTSLPYVASWAEESTCHWFPLYSFQACWAYQVWTSGTRHIFCWPLNQHKRRTWWAPAVKPPATSNWLEKLTHRMFYFNIRSYIKDVCAASPWGKWREVVKDKLFFLWGLSHTSNSLPLEKNPHLPCWRFLQRFLWVTAHFW